MSLGDSAIDQDEPGKFFFLLLQAAITPGHGLAHACKVIVLPGRISVGSFATSPFLRAPFLATNDEFAIVGFFHASLFPNHHRRDGVRSVAMRNVEALYALWLFSEVEGILQGFANCFRARLQNAKTLF